MPVSAGDATAAAGGAAAICEDAGAAAASLAIILAFQSSTSNCGFSDSSGGV